MGDTNGTALVTPAHFQPRPWGRIGTGFLINNPRGMLVEDPGMGKTAQVYSALDLLMLGGSSFFPALVIAPKRVAEVVWTTEAAKWDAFQHLRVVRLTGEIAERTLALQVPADVYVINYDLVPWLVSQFTPERWPFKIVIADESSRLKGFRLSKGTVRAKSLSMIARYTGRWWNLTGTPTPNGLQDLWGQMWFVDFGQRLKRSYTAYLEAFFLQNPYSRKITLQDGAEAEINKLVSDRLVAVRAIDWLPLKKPQELFKDVQMPERVKVQYKKLEKETFLALPDAEIDAGTAGVVSQKLLQFASGSVYDADKRDHAVHEEKIEALKEIVEETGDEPLLIAYQWVFDVPRILKAFPDFKQHTPENELLFRKGKIKGLLLHWQSSFGLNLADNCRDVVAYSYKWSGELWQQMLDRTGPVRQFQLGKQVISRIWTIRTVGTIEQDVIDSNNGKISVEQAFKRAQRRVLND